MVLNRFVRVVLIASAVYGLAACATLNIDERNIFSPPKKPTEQTAWPAQTVLAQYPNVAITHGKLQGQDLTIAYTLIRNASQQRPVVVHCGGNASDRYNSGPAYANKALAHADVVLFDYPGYGDSTGTPSPTSLTATQDLLVPLVQREFAGRDVYLWGHSLGGFVCGALLNKLPTAKGIIFETTARNVPQVAQAWTPWYAKPFVKINIAQSLLGYDNADTVIKTNTPALVLGAGQDNQLPVQLSRQLSDALKQGNVQVTYVEVPDAKHENIPSFAVTQQAIAQFIKQTSSTTR